MEKEFIDSILTRNIAWFSAADSKIAPILAIDTAMLGVLFALLAKNPISFSSSLIVPFISAVLLVLSILNLVVCTFPQLSGPKNSIIYFGGITEYTTEDYKSKINNISDLELMEEITEQCHRNAEIANSKFQRIRWAMIFLYISFLFWLPAMAILYV